MKTTPVGTPACRRTSPRVSWLARQVLRFRWWIAGPVLRPILKEWDEIAELSSHTAKRDGSPRDWKIECIARSEINSVHVIEIEKAFGCTSFNDKHQYVRHYS